MYCTQYVEWIGQGNYWYSKMWEIDFAFDLFYNYLLSENVSENNIIKIEPDQRKITSSEIQ